MVYPRTMGRTNIDLDDERLALIMPRYGIHTKTEAVDLALRYLGGQPMSIAEALDMRGVRAIREVPADTPP